jgi:hypothetical protein
VVYFYLYEFYSHTFGLDDVQLIALISSIQEVLKVALSTYADLEKLPASYLLPHRHP